MQVTIKSPTRKTASQTDGERGRDACGCWRPLRSLVEDVNDRRCCNMFVVCAGNCYCCEKKKKLKKKKAGGDDGREKARPGPSESQRIEARELPCSVRRWAVRQCDDTTCCYFRAVRKRPDLRVSWSSEGEPAELAVGKRLSSERIPKHYVD